MKSRRLLGFPPRDKPRLPSKGRRCSLKSSPKFASSGGNVMTREPARHTLRMAITAAFVLVTDADLVEQVRQSRQKSALETLAFTE
jgi:hypothetical protein